MPQHSALEAACWAAGMLQPCLDAVELEKMMSRANTSMLFVSLLRSVDLYVTRVVLASAVLSACVCGQGSVEALESRAPGRLSLEGRAQGGYAARPCFCRLLPTRHSMYGLGIPVSVSLRDTDKARLLGSPELGQSSTSRNLKRSNLQRPLVSQGLDGHGNCML